MTSSLRDALRQSGVLDQFKTTPDRPRPNRADGKPPQRGRPGPDRGHRGTRGAGKPVQTNTGSQRPPSNRAQRSEDIDLAKAYALRAQTEQREREQKEKAEREAAERRRHQREKVTALLEGRTLNREDAETPRHFEYGGKIRRVYVTDEQLAQVNDGTLGVIQMRGRYLLVERALAEEIRGVDGHAVALLVDPEDAGGLWADPADPEGHGASAVSSAGVAAAG